MQTGVQDFEIKSKCSYHTILKSRFRKIFTSVRSKQEYQILKSKINVCILLFWNRDLDKYLQVSDPKSVQDFEIKNKCSYHTILTSRFQKFYKCWNQDLYIFHDRVFKIFPSVSTRIYIFFMIEISEIFTSVGSRTCIFFMIEFFKIFTSVGAKTCIFLSYWEFINIYRCRNQDFVYFSWLRFRKYWNCWNRAH